MNENRQPSTRGMRARGPKRPLLALLILLAALLAASCGGAGEGGGAAPADDARRAAQPEAPATEASEAEGTRDGEKQARVDQGHPALGEEDAPVVMVEYADYQ